MKYSTLTPEIREKLQQLDTPFFLFDLDIISNKLTSIKKLLNPDNIYYAVKCNSLPHILKTLQDGGCSFEVNNMAEVEKAVSCGAPPVSMINSSPITPAEDVAAMFAKGIRRFVYDSKEQVDNLSRNAPGAYVTFQGWSSLVRKA